MSLANIGLGYLAGVLTILSPCVLPLLPIVLGSALSAHRFGMAALTAGLVLSFAGVGLFIATIGFSIGLDDGFFRSFSAIVLGVLGVVMLSGALQRRFAGATAAFGDRANILLGRLKLDGLGGQFVVGVILGAVWGPCVGPTLGAASLLAAQGKDLASVGLTMAAFALGAATPLAIIGSLSREALKRWRGRLASAGGTGKTLLGAAALIVAVMILTGGDRGLEAFLVDSSPDWLTDLSTRF